MLPFEFTLPGPPVSHQTKNRSRLQKWKATVGKAAQATWHYPGPTMDDVSVTITYFYEGESPDVDNIIKPIQDGIIGIVYGDDDQVVDVKSRKRSINGSYRIRGVSAILLAAFAQGDEFLHIVIDKAPDMAALE